MLPTLFSLTRLLVRLVSVGCHLWDHVVVVLSLHRRDAKEVGIRLHLGVSAAEVGGHYYFSVHLTIL